MLKITDIVLTETKEKGESSMNNNEITFSEALANYVKEKVDNFVENISGTDVYIDEDFDVKEYLTDMVVEDISKSIDKDIDYIFTNLVKDVDITQTTTKRKTIQVLSMDAIEYAETLVDNYDIDFDDFDVDEDVEYDYD